MEDKKGSAIRVTPVVETMPADLLTPLAVYLKLSVNTDNSFLLESVEGGKNLARYSFIGARPERVVVGGHESFKAVREHFSVHAAETDSDLPAFIGGAIGFIGFDACEWFEPSLSTGDEQPDLCSFMFYRSVVAFDHAKQEIKIISLVFSDDSTDVETTKLFDSARLENSQIRRILETTNIDVPKSAAASRHEPASNWKSEDFEGAVLKIKDLIAAGECYQAVLSQCFTRRTDASPVAIYRALRSLNPSPYMFLLKFAGRAIVGASPEMLVRCESGRLEYRPIAGTRRRGTTTEEDDSLAEDMLCDKKEVAEHMMLVDLGRNDLGRVAGYGSINVDTLMKVEKYSHVQHMVSSLSARLAGEYDRFDALAACFPAGTVSGAPKVRSIEIIRELEPTPRGVYSGAVGYFDYSGNMDTCIAIRTLVLENGIAKIQAGAGIVADSVPSLEFEETVNKAKVLLRAVDIAESGIF